jgi:hypothetical protein
MGLVTIGWGASATYESVTGVVSVLSPACFAAFFVGTYSAAIVFLPVNLATGALCGEGHLHEGPQSDAKDHAVAWQFATSAFLVLVGAGVCTWGLSVPCHHCFFLLLARTPLLPSARRLLMHTNYSVPPPPLLSPPRAHARTFARTSCMLTVLTRANHCHRHHCPQRTHACSGFHERDMPGPSPQRVFANGLRG